MILPTDPIFVQHVTVNKHCLASNCMPKYTIYSIQNTFSFYSEKLYTKQINETFPLLVFRFVPILGFVVA